MKKLFLISILFAFPAFAEPVRIVVSPGSAQGSAMSAPIIPPTIPGELTTPDQVITAAKSGVGYAKAKNWFGLSSVLIFILVWVLKTAGLFKKIAKRWIYIIVPGLGISAMLLAQFAGGVSLDQAWLVLASAPCAALFSDFVKRGILNQEYETKMKPPGAVKKLPLVLLIALAFIISGCGATLPRHCTSQAMFGREGANPWSESDCKRAQTKKNVLTALAAGFGASAGASGLSAAFPDSQDAKIAIGVTAMSAGVIAAVLTPFATSATSDYANHCVNR